VFQEGQYDQREVPYFQEGKEAEGPEEPDGHPELLDGESFSAVMGFESRAEISETLDHPEGEGEVEDRKKREMDCELFLPEGKKQKERDR